MTGLPLSGILVMAAVLEVLTCLVPIQGQWRGTAEEQEGLELMHECEVSGWLIHTCAF